MDKETEERLAKEKYDKEWIEASYKTMGWNKPTLLNNEEWEGETIWRKQKKF